MPSGTHAASTAGHLPVALTIAGFDPSSGAGVTADLQVFAAHGLFGTACITALTVQSTQGVYVVEPVSHLIGATLEKLADDLPPDGIKIGMLADAAAVRAVCEFLRGYRHLRQPVVLDPVLVSSSGRRLLDAEGLLVMREELLPLVDWITPNFAELEELVHTAVILDSDAEDAARWLHRAQPHLHIAITGGDVSAEATVVDRLFTADGGFETFVASRVETTSTHGTGCAFSSALLSRLILGETPAAAVSAAKAYVTEALRSAPGLGKGRGPLNLLWPLTSKH